MAPFAERIQRLNADRGHLCVGIDPRPGRFPAEYQAWCLDLVDATHRYAAAYKPNLAYFLTMGPAGIEALEATCVAARASGALVLLDAKFGDIGTTASAYARFARDVAGANAVTINPYLGTDVADAFQEQGLDVFVLARTTNPSAEAIQAHAADPVTEVFGELDVGFVAPGNKPERLADVRARVGDAPLLIPGIGAHGGTPEAAGKAAQGGPYLLSVSRGISQAEGTFPESATQAAAELAQADR